MTDRQSSPAARIVLVLHAHLPYVRLEGSRLPLQELWLHQNLFECYLPMLKATGEMIRGGSRFALTLSFSPTLISMLDDPYYQERFLDYLETMLQLSESPSLKKRPDLRIPLAHYREGIVSIRDYYLSLGGDLIGELKKQAGSAGVGLITTAATHALLPAFRFNEKLVCLQIDRGFDIFEKAMGFRPRGFWLPEMGYYTGLDRLLAGSGVEYSFLDTHGAYGAGHPPTNSIFAPSRSPAGVRFFFRDVVLSDAIWSKHGGYPGDYGYREFHADTVYTLSEEELSAAGTVRIPLGLKLHRITGGDREKEPYDPRVGMEAAERHAADFLHRIIRRAGEVSALTGDAPVFTLPFDMELFGHWWHEGVHFLVTLMDLIARSEQAIMVRPDSIAEDTRSVFSPAESSWGRGGYFGTWLSPECLGYYGKIGALHDRLERTGSRGHEARAALHEIMLAQASDWSFFMTWETFRDYGRERIEEHMSSAETIITGIEQGKSDAGFIEERRRRYPRFSAFPPPCGS